MKKEEHVTSLAQVVQEQAILDEYQAPPISNWSCCVCDCDCKSEVSYESHVRGKAHKQAVLKAKFSIAKRPNSPLPEVSMDADDDGTDRDGAELLAAWDEGMPQKYM